MTFFDLSRAARFAFGSWSLLICLAGAAGMLLAFSIRRRRYGALAFVPFAAAYILWQIQLTGLSHAGIEQAQALALFLGDAFWRCRYLVLTGLTALAAVPFLLCRNYTKRQITPLTVKRCADEMRCGICYYRENGHIIFANSCMDSLYTALTGKRLMDGRTFPAAAPEGSITADGRVWNVSVRDITLEGESIREIIVTDVTEIHAKKEALREENEKLSALGQELKSYGLLIDDTVRRQEILQAKRSIHNEMNRLMLSILTTDLAEEEELNRLFSLWEKNVLLFCMEAEEKSDEKAAKQLEELAEALGLQLIWKSRMPAGFDPKQSELFYAAAQEAVINAVKHGGAESLTISFRESREESCCVFENDGNTPEGAVRFTGGLANLSLLAGLQKAAVSAEAGEGFRLILHFQK